MGIKSYNPYTPSRRHMTGSDFSEITKSTPEKSLTVSLKKNAGRNNQGKITVRHQGGGSRRKYRIIDFKRRKDGIPATVVSIEYDPNRTANIALISYVDGEKAYILAPEGLKVGQKVMNGADAEVRVGNCLPLELIPVGTMVHNIELHPGKGGQMVRSAGNGAQLMAKEGKYATLRLPSGEMRMVPIVCRASVGVVGNGDHNLINSRNFRVVSGKKIQGLPRHGFSCSYGERQQRPLFPGRCQEAGTGRRRRPCGLQGQCGGHCFPAGRRYPFRYGLLWLPDDRGSQGKEQVRKNLRCCSS